MTTQRLPLIGGLLLLVCCAAQALADGTNSGTNTGPGTLTNPRPIDILGQPGGGSSGNPVPQVIAPPPVTLSTGKLDSNATRVWIRRSQTHQYLAAGRVVTGQVYGSDGGLLRITYREYVRVHSSVTGRWSEEDLLQVELGPEQNQDFTYPVLIDRNPQVRESERNSYMVAIGQWSQLINQANQQMDVNRSAYQQTADPSLQAIYANAYQQWATRKTTLETGHRNLQYQLLVRQE